MRKTINNQLSLNYTLETQNFPKNLINKKQLSNNMWLIN
uniref:Uncharacterized protein n=1 Tax=Anguilla anguilla TaxID=7936 RepID=A0A0E9QU97_ANGAN